MKQFKILAESITGLTSKQLLKGQIHPETEFVKGHCDVLCGCGLIEEVKAAPIKKQAKDPLGIPDAE